jgi:hypothetical protein
LCNFLHPPVTSSRPNILLNTLFSNTFSRCSFLMWETNFHTNTLLSFQWLINWGKIEKEKDIYFALSCFF